MKKIKELTNQELCEAARKTILSNVPNDTTILGVHDLEDLHDEALTRGLTVNNDGTIDPRPRGP